ncbi:hypothetical protein AAVH_11516 [Aphelenchoides avenae]|nr:hypothetical protein AAVH_11516 [Aphelenchus avenae]
MRLSLPWSFQRLRPHGITPFAKHAFAEFATFDANRRLLSSFNAAWSPPAILRKRSSSRANGITSTCAVNGHLLLKSNYNLVLIFLRKYHDGHRGRSRRAEESQVVAVSSDVWQLLVEYDVPATLRNIFNVHIRPTITMSQQVQLALRGWKASQVAAMLADPPRKIDVPEEVSFWLTTEGPHGVRVKDIRMRSGALVKPSKDNRSVLIVGSSEATLAARSMIDECDCTEEFGIDDCVGFYLVDDDAFHQKRFGVRGADGLHVKRRRVPQAVCLWLTNPVEGGKHARAMDIGRKFDASISIGYLTDDNDNARMVDLVVVGEREENVDGVLATIDACDCIEELNIDSFIGFYLINNDCFNQKRLCAEIDALMLMPPVVGAAKWPAVLVGSAKSVKRLKNKLDALHVKRRRIPQAVCWWLTRTGKGASARSMDLNRTFNVYIGMEGASDDRDAARMVDIAVVGEREEDIGQVFSELDHLVVEKVHNTKLQEEFWMGHEDEQNRNRPLHKLEETTDACVVQDYDATCMYVIGTPEVVKRAVESISKTRHIKLKTGPAEISPSAGNYVARIRHMFENDDLQIHLRYEGMRPGTCELRRLHRVDSEQDDAKADDFDKEVMRALDIHEIVLHVPAYTRYLGPRLKPTEQSTTCGITYSMDVISRGVLFGIAGSRTTVKRGMEEVLRLITSGRRYKVGDIRLRRIEGQRVDTAGFEEDDQVGEEDLSDCKEPFVWERLTREQWRYTGRCAPENKRKRSTKRHKASENRE